MVLACVFLLLTWIANLQLGSCSASARIPGLELHVLAYRRPHCLERLLRSLQDAEYIDEHVISLTVHIDGASGSEASLVQETVAVSHNFTWPHGPFEVIPAKTHQGLFASWFNAISPDPDRWALILEDDLTVSRFFYRYLWATWMQYKDRDSFAGISLQQHWGDVASLAGIDDSAMQRPYLSQVPGPWGFSPHPTVWQRFLDWTKANHGLNEELPGLKLSAWYSAARREGRSDNIWTFHFASFCDKYNFKTLYAPIFRGASGERQGLVANHREQGEHFDGSEGPDVSIYMGYNWTLFTDLPDVLERVPWDVERRALYEGGRLLNAYGSSNEEPEEHSPNHTDAASSMSTITKSHRFPARGFPERLSWGQHFYISFGIMVVLVATFYFVKQKGSNMRFGCLLELCLWVACAVVAEYGLPTEKRLSEGNADVFWAVILVAAICSLFHKNVDKGDAPMNRNMTNEWKGMMQLVFEMYHYTDYYNAYAPVRASVSAYVWLTGWGNTMFFKSKQDHSISRVLFMVFRIGAFCPLLACGTQTPWISYYIVVLHTSHFLLTWLFSLCGGFSERPFKGAVVLKLMLLAGLIQVLTIDPIADNIQVGVESIFGSSFASYLRYRMEMDRFSSIPGMLIGYYWEDLCSLLETKRVVGRIACLTGAILGFGAWLFVATRYQYADSAERQNFTQVHPYVSTFWIPLFVLCRNATPWLRRTTLRPFEMLGERSLELYLLQFNLFLARQASHNLVITGYPSVDVYFCWIILLFGAGRCFAGTKDAWNIYRKSISLCAMTALLFASCIVLTLVLSDMSWQISSCLGLVCGFAYLVLAERGPKLWGRFTAKSKGSGVVNRDPIADGTSIVTTPKSKASADCSSIVDIELDPEITIHSDQSESTTAASPDTARSDPELISGSDPEVAGEELAEPAGKDLDAGKMASLLSRSAGKQVVPRWCGSLVVFLLLVLASTVWNVAETGAATSMPATETTTVSITTSTTTRPPTFGGGRPTPAPATTQAPEATEPATSSTTTTSVRSVTTRHSSFLGSTTASSSVTRMPVPGMVNTLTAMVADRGTTTLHLADVSEISVGMYLTISSTTNSESKVIHMVSVARRLSSDGRRLLGGLVTVDSPLQHTYAAGAVVVAVPPTKTTTMTTTTTTAKTTATTTRAIPFCKVDDLEWVPDHITSTAQLQRKADRNCIWKRFSRSEAREMLKDRHVLLTGDSTMNYQYLALIMFLHEGVSIGPGGPREWMLYQSNGPNAMDNQWFVEYYRNTSEVFGGDEFCDCNRDVPCHPTCTPQTFVQNRYYRLGNKGYVAFAMTGGDILPPRGHKMDLAKWELKCDKVPCDHPADWEEDPSSCYVDVLRNLVQRYTPDILVQGVDNHMIQPYPWLVKFLGKVPDRSATLCGMDWVDFGAAVTKDLGVTSGGTRGAPLVLTRPNLANRTTMMSVYEDQATVSPTQADASQQVMYDTEYLTKLLSAPPLRGYPLDVMKDEVHTQPWVNFELNMWLLNVIAQRINAM